MNLSSESCNECAGKPLIIANQQFASQPPSEETSYDNREPSRPLEVFDSEGELVFVYANDLPGPPTTQGPFNLNELKQCAMMLYKHAQTFGYDGFSEGTLMRIYYKLATGYIIVPVSALPPKFIRYMAAQERNSLIGHNTSIPQSQWQDNLSFGNPSPIANSTTARISNVTTDRPDRSRHSGGYAHMMWNNKSKEANQRQARYQSISAGNKPNQSCKSRHRSLTPSLSFFDENERNIRRNGNGNDSNSYLKNTGVAQNRSNLIKKEYIERREGCTRPKIRIRHRSLSFYEKIEKNDCKPELR